MPKYKTKPVKPMTVEAVLCTAITGSGGEYLVTEPDGTQYFLKPAEFEARFELVAGSRKRAQAEAQPE
jgi:hypothetical protein